MATIITDSGTSIEVTPTDLGALLFSIHTHNTTGHGEVGIFYSEEKLLELLSVIGLEVEWGNSMTIREFKDKQDGR